jgi:hypothetical protein
VKTIANEAHVGSAMRTVWIERDDRIRAEGRDLRRKSRSAERTLRTLSAPDRFAEELESLDPVRPELGEDSGMTFPAAVEVGRAEPSVAIGLVEVDQSGDDPGPAARQVIDQAIVRVDKLGEAFEWVRSRRRSRVGWAV